MLNSTSKSDIESHGVQIDRVFVYFDELRTTGSDFPLKTDALASLTFNPNDTSLRSILQGTLRARGFFRMQQVDIVMQRDALDGMIGFDKNNKKACVEINNLWNTALRNQSNQLKNELKRSALEQIKEAYRSAVSQKLVAAFAAPHVNAADQLTLFQAAEWLFVTTFNDSPADLFLDLECEMPAAEVVENTYRSIHQRFIQTCQAFFTLDEVAAIQQEADKVIEFAKDKLTWKTKATDQQLGIQVTVQKQVEIQKEVNVEVQKETQKELQKYATRVDAPAALAIPWELLKTPPTSFADYKAPPTLSFTELLAKMPYEADYHTIFPQDLTLSENFSKSHEIDLPVFHKAQKKAHHLLLYRDGSGFHSLFIDLAEAEFWRKQIQLYDLKDCWLSDINGRSLNENHPIPEDVKPALERVQWWGHFFNGNANYLRAHPPLVEQELKGPLYPLKYRFLSLKTANDPAQNKILLIDPLLSENPGPPPVFSFHSKAAEEEWRHAELNNLSQGELNRLPFHFSRFLTKEQIPLLTRKGYFSYLPPDKFAAVTLAQIPLIPNHRLRFLTEKEQIEAVPGDKVAWLKGPGLNHLPLEHLERINQEELIHLTEERQKLYQENMIARFTLEGFSKKVVPAMAPVIIPACVPFLHTHCIAKLATKEQLAALPLDKYHLLAACQFHLTPETQWANFQLVDLQKYLKEETIVDEARPFIEKIASDLVNQIDPRLARFYTQAQVEKITIPTLIPHLDIDQLVFLNKSLAPYLEVKQLPLLTAKHMHLIKALTEPESLSRLSNEALILLEPQQVQSIGDRATLLRLPEHFYPLLKARQIGMLRAEEIKDQALIQKLIPDQLTEVEKTTLKNFLPYLNPKALQTIDPDIITSTELDFTVRKKLTAKQLQSYLISREAREIEALLLEVTPKQWKILDEQFINSFFTNQPKEVIKCVPPLYAPQLPKEALLLWHDRDIQSNRLLDRVVGFFSLIFYPITLLTALFRGRNAPSFKEGFQHVAASPLRLFSIESYLRFYTLK